MTRKRYIDTALFMCPWHKEKTPSCHVNYDENRHICFGCGHTGTAQELHDRLRRAMIPMPDKRAAEHVDLP